MTIDLGQILQSILSVLFFPWLKTALDFVWAANDPMWLMAVKRTFLLLPVLGAILSYWTSICNLLSIPIRSHRAEFLNRLLVTWWDLCKGTIQFWIGIFQFALTLVLTVYGVARLAVVGIYIFFYDLILIPVRVARHLGGSVATAGVPYIAVSLTFFWCILEAVIFTFVMTPLVMDTMSNMTGQALTEGFIRIPLFIFMLFIVLGAYAVLSKLSDAIETKDWGQIAKIGLIEGVAMFVEVMFLYREFVDALVPWFAQHSEGFELGMFGTLLIAGVTWLGIRSLSWFLFANSGTPTIMAIIQGNATFKGSGSHGSLKNLNYLEFSVSLIDQLKKESKWLSDQGKKILEAFLLPPLQVIAATLNFLTLFISARHMFDLPIQDLESVSDTRALLKNLSKDKKESAA